MRDAEKLHAELVDLRAELSSLYDQNTAWAEECEQLRAKLAAWEPVVRALGVLYGTVPNSDEWIDAGDAVWDAYDAIPPEHRPEVEP